MIFVDTNVFMYAVGREHPLRQEAQDFFIQSRKSKESLVSSAEVAQELLHAYLPVGRIETLDAAMEIFYFGLDHIFDITIEDVRHARNLVEILPTLTARDLLHLSICQRNKITKIKTYDQALRSAFPKNSRGKK
ncbi:MAG: type II toxin-antitoxin system VapC family toxin [bacterium]